jgi:hypothetical protein
MLCVFNSVCHYTWCRYADCRGAKGTVGNVELKAELSHIQVLASLISVIFAGPCHLGVNLGVLPKGVKSSLVCYRPNIAVTYFRRDSNP